MGLESDFRARIRKSPGWFAREILGESPWEKQIEIMDAVLNDPLRRVAVSGCTSSSKTRSAAMTVVSWLLAYSPLARVYTFAPSGRQVAGNLWGEIRRMELRAKTCIGGTLMPKDTRWEFGPDWFAHGFTTDQPEMVHGIHGRNILVILDDAHGISKEMSDEIENIKAGATTTILMLYNKTRLSGPTHDCNHRERKLWRNIAIPYSSTPNARANAPVIPEMLTPATVEDWKIKFGEESNAFRIKVLDEYPTQESDTLIPLDWIEMAVARRNPPGVPVLGVDVARFGDDESVFAPLLGRKLMALDCYRGQDLMETVGRAEMKRKEIRSAYAYVDEIGMGSGVVDRWREVVQTSAAIMGINVAEKARDEEQFANLRAELYWHLREAFNPKGVAPLEIPNDPDLIAQLSAIKYKINSAGKIQMEPKEDTKKRLGQSPDRADALMLANAHFSGVRPAAGMSAKPVALGGGMRGRGGLPDWA